MIVTQGIILGTEPFNERVIFYRDILQLRVWYEKPGLVCRYMSDGYLMIETGGAARYGRKLNT